MAKAFDLRLIGDKALIKKFDRLAKVESAKVMRSSIREAGRPIFNEARRRAPVVTGKLKASLKYRALRRSRSRVGMQIITQLEYASFIELGTNGNPGRAFMRGAADEYREAFPREVGRIAGPKIESAAKKA